MSDEEVVNIIEEAEQSPDDSLPPVSELIGPERRLDGRVRYLWILRASISALVLSGIGGIIGFAVLNAFWPAGVVFTVFFALGVVLTVARYRAWCYEVRDDSLFLSRGVFTRVRTVVPYVRIQHVDVSEGPIERSLGLASVVVYTAGSRGADVTIPGLTPERANDLQTRLKQLAIVAEGEDAV